MTVHYLATRKAWDAINTSPASVLETLAEDLQELTWLDGRISAGFYDVHTVHRSDGETHLLLKLPATDESFRLTTDEALELVVLIIKHDARPGTGTGSGKVAFRVLQGGRA
jgi:hypothetical protein